MDYSYIDRNVLAVREKISEARERGVHKKDVMLVAAVKYAEYCRDKPPD